MLEIKATFKQPDQPPALYDLQYFVGEWLFDTTYAQGVFQHSLWGDIYVSEMHSMGLRYAKETQPGVATTFSISTHEMEYWRLPSLSRWRDNDPSWLFDSLDHHEGISLFASKPHYDHVVNAARLCAAAGLCEWTQRWVVHNDGLNAPACLQTALWIPQANLGLVTFNWVTATMTSVHAQHGCIFLAHHLHQPGDHHE